MADVARKPFTRIILVTVILFLGFHSVVPIQLPAALTTWSGIGHLVIVAIFALVFAAILCRLGTRGKIVGLGDDEVLPLSQLPPHAKSDH